MSEGRRTVGPKHPHGALAREVAVRLGLACQPLRAVVGSGSVNHVYVTGAGDERRVIRFARDPLCNAVFEAEAWSAARAKKLGVPTPATTAVGELRGIPYGVQRFVAGHLVTDDTSALVWSTLGAYGRIINGIQPDRSTPATLFSRFGQDLKAAWASHLSYNLEQLDRKDPLLRNSVLTRKQQQSLRATVLDLSDVPLDHGLSHGDLTPRNLIQPDAGPLVLIDWGSATFGPVPWTDLLAIDQDARVSGIAATRRLEAFLDGMGLDLSTVRPTFEKFRRLQLLDLVRWATDQRPDRLDSATNDLMAAL